MSVIWQHPKTLKIGRVLPLYEENKRHLAQISDVSEGFRRLPFISSWN